MKQSRQEKRDSFLQVKETPCRRELKMSLAEMDAGFGREAEEGGPRRRVKGFPRTRQRRTGGRTANESEWRGMDGDAGCCLTPPAREGPSGRITAVGPFPSAAPGPASMFAGAGPSGGREPLDRRSRPPGPASPRPNSPRGRRRPGAGCAPLSRSAFPSAGRWATRPRRSGRPPGPGVL